jgi:chromosome segregation ATPase
MDESTELIAKLTAEIQEIEAEIEEKETTIKEIEEQLLEATRNREDENAEWVKTDKDDTDAGTTVQAARDVLYDFYTSNNLMFVQKGKAPVVEAGKAPPPPPSTWDAPYGGKTEQSSGIIAILEMIQEDIADDQKKAKAAEDESQAKFDEFKKESLAQIQSLNEDIAALTTSKAEKAEAVSEETEMRANTKAELASTMGMIKDAEPGCDYITITYPRKLSNRQIEIDGLRKAKGILQGAKFDEVDPNREIKPGDAASALQLSKVGLRK